MKNSFLILDNHEIVMIGLKYLLKETYLNAEVKAVNNCDDAIESLKHHNFSLIIFDMQHQGKNSNDFIKTALSIQPEAKILIFSASRECNLAKHYYKIGIKGVLCKESGTRSEIINAIETILKGKKYITPDMLIALSEDTIKGYHGNPFSNLSHRELEIAKYLIEGEKVSGISKNLDLASSTIGTFKARIYEKLNVTNIMGLTSMANLYNFKNGYNNISHPGL